MMPSITATAIFVMILSWNEYVFALFLTSTGARTMPPRLWPIRLVPASPGMFWEQPSHSSPRRSFCFVLIVQRQLISGLSQGTLRQMMPALQSHSRDEGRPWLIS